MLTHVLFYAIAPKNYQCKLTVVAWMSRDGGWKKNHGWF